MQARIVLASTSSYRRELLQRLYLPFTVVAPAVDERGRPDENPAALASRLAVEKALAGAASAGPGALVIGSDQVAELDGCALGKPGSHEAARAQLERMSRRTVIFHTAVAVADARRAQDGTDGASSGPDLSTRFALVPTTVRFRPLDAGLIETYLAIDRPYNCAGSAKVESLGIRLLESVESTDPTALIGLPLIALVSLLLEFGLAVPATAPMDCAP